MHAFGQAAPPTCVRTLWMLSWKMNRLIKNWSGQLHSHSLNALVHQNVKQFFILWSDAYHIFDLGFDDW